MQRLLQRGPARCAACTTRPPYAEDKLVRCTSGAIFDVIVDIRRDSPTFRRWFGVSYRRNRWSLFIPKGFAHGFVTLATRPRCTI